MARYNVDLQDNEGNAYQIMANPDSVAEFSPAANRENIRSGETYRVIFGKIMKYLSEVGNAAYVGLANNCTTTIAGFALDARQGKELMDRINELNRDIDTILQKLSRGFRIELSIGQYIWKPENESQWHGSGDSARITLEISADGIAIAKVTNPGDFRAYGTDHGRINKVGIVSIHPL